MAAAPAALADEVLRAMVVTELKVALGALVCATLLVTGAATWDRHEPLGTPIAVAANVAAPVEKSQPAPAPQDPLDLLNEISVSVRGTVRDELGRRVAHAWIGTQVRLRDDFWKPIKADRIRDRQEPFRDDHGKVVPPGALGKYFELSDELGNWQPIDPRDIRSHVPSGYTGQTVDLRDQAVTLPIPAAGPFDVRVSKGRPWMGLLPSTGGEDYRTNADGDFVVGLQIRPGSSVTLHAASRDFSRRAVKVVRADGPNQPVQTTLKRVRQVHSRVIETPIDHPELLLHWELYSIDEKGLDASDFDFLQDRAPKWAEWPTEAVWGGGFAPP